MSSERGFLPTDIRRCTQVLLAATKPFRRGRLIQQVLLKIVPRLEGSSPLSGGVMKGLFGARTIKSEKIIAEEK